MLGPESLIGNKPLDVYTVKYDMHVPHHIPSHNEFNKKGWDHFYQHTIASQVKKVETWYSMNESLSNKNSNM